MIQPQSPRVGRMAAALMTMSLLAVGSTAAGPAASGGPPYSLGGVALSFSRELPQGLPHSGRARLLLVLADDAPADTLARLEALGLSLQPAGARGLFAVGGEAAALAALAGMQGVAGLALLPPEAKLAAALRRPPLRADAPRTVQALLYRDVEPEQARQALERLAPASAIRIDEVYSRATVTLPAGRLRALAALDEVFQIWPEPPPLQVENINSRDTMDVEKVEVSHPWLDGTGVRLGIWDGGKVMDTHLDFGGRVSQQDAASGISSHGTHVAGTMVGSGDGSNTSPSLNLTRGMAPAAELWAWDFYDDLAELDAAGSDITASNHSYGYITGWNFGYGASDLWHWFGDPAESEEAAFGKYDSTAAAYDQVVWEHDRPLFKSGGNERDDGGVAAGVEHRHGTDTVSTYTDGHAPDYRKSGFDTLSYFGVGKNVIAVGSVNDLLFDPVNPGLVNTAAYSSWGPADDGRIKPDLVANGEGVTSTGTASDTASATASGTSMAAPAATGVSALLFQRAAAGPRAGLRVGAAEIKGLLVHGALDTGSVGPDYRYGWGLINARQSLAAMDAEFAGGGAVRRGAITAASPQQSMALTTGAGALKATLVWIDRPAAPNTGGVDDPAPALVNDLDLQLTSPTGVVHHPWTLDPANPFSAAVRSGPNRVDPVEQVKVDTADGEAGEWTLHVSLNGGLSGASQPYYLLVTFPCGAGDTDCDGCVVDADGDRVCADRDVCPDRRDPLQQDRDADGEGDACDADDRLVQGLAFTDAATLSWDAETGVDGYNVYRKVVSSPGSTDAGDCLSAGAAPASLEIAEAPASAGQVWLLQVAVSGPGGQGPLGEGRDGQARVPAVACP